MPAHPGDQYPGKVDAAGQGSGYQYALHLGAKPGVIPLRPLTLGDILDGTFQVMRRLPGPIFGSAAIVATVMAMATTFATWVMATQLAGMLDSSTAPAAEEMVGTFALASAVWIVSTAIAFLAQAVLSGVLVVPTGKATTGHGITFAEVWREALPRAGALIGWALLLTVAEVAVFVLTAAPVIALTVALNEPGWLFLLFLLIPAWLAGLVWVLGRLSFVPAVMMLEKVGIGRGFSRSRSLSTGSFWRIVGILVLGMIITWMVALVLSVPGSIISGIVAAIQEPDPASALGGTPLQLMVNALTLILTRTIALPFMSILTTMVYVDTRIRREGLDVQLARAAAQRS
ncbi:MAG: hypothetical protein ACK5MT_15015 [Actinomycetales bacterium]